MPTPFIDGSSVLTKVYSFVNGQMGLNTYAYTGSGGAGGPTYEGQADAWLAFIQPLYVAMLPQAVTFYGVSITQYETPMFPEYGSKALAGTVGSIVSPPLPTQNCITVTKQTATAGRIGRGRIYVPFPPASAMGPSGQVANTYRTIVNTQMTAILISTGFTLTEASGATVNWVPVLAHGTGAGATFLPITSFKIGRLWATQRRRGDYGRPNVPPF